ncbi:MAG: glycoside hydrolase family 16 protein, partial [Flavobacteriales bacterium]
MAFNANAQTFDTLVWSDEFNVNGSVDTTNWFHQTLLPPNNGQSWWNGEIQHYTNRDTNSSVSGGKLYLTALKETFTDQGVTKDYTSARLNSKFAFTYGRVEIRAQLPLGIGTWPALWMLGQNITETGA